MVLVVGISALPLFALFFYLKKRLPRFGDWLFVAALAAGALSMLLASLLQLLFPTVNAGTVIALMYTVFIRNALTEELGRLIVLIPFLWILPFFYQVRNSDVSEPSQQIPLHTAVFIGITSGFSLAMLETISYGMLDLRLVILRTLTSAPLHGACAARIAAAAQAIQVAFVCTLQEENPQTGQVLKAFTYISSAILIHGVYNMLLLFPSSFAILPVILAYVALASAFALTKGEKKVW